MVNNIPVNGWPQLKDLEAVQPTLDRLDKIEAWKRTVKEETFTGDDITIENALALPARSLITEIEAIQDLHGLPFPYVGGAYKNKLPLDIATIKRLNTSGTWNGNVYTVYGGTFTIQTDNDGNVTGVVVDGTFTETALLIFINSNDMATDFTKTILGKTIILNGCPTRTGNPYAQMFNTWGTTSPIYDNGTDPATLAVPSTISGYRCQIEVYRGTVSNVLFKPMIRLSTETDASFAPYSNICPISGRTAATVTVSDGDEISEDFTIQLGQTVYGADINWDTGVLTVKTAKVDLGSLTWVSENSSVLGLARVNVDETQALGAIYYQTPKSSSFKGVPPTAYVAFAYNEIGFSNSESSPFVRVRSEALIGLSDAQIKSYMTGIDFEYELATPTTIQLTPEQVQMLKGYNRVTLSDGYGTIELKALTGANWS